MINTLINDFHDLEWFKIFKQKNLKISPVIIIDNDKFKKQIKSLFPKSNFIDQRDAVRCKNFNIEKKHNKLKKLKKFEKIGINLLKKYLIFDNLSYNYKKQIYYKTANYWLFEIEDKKIDIFLSKTTPHHFYDYIIYYCFKALNKKTFSLNSINLPDRLYLTEDINNRKIKFNLTKSINKSNVDIASKKYNSISKLNFNKNMPWYIKKYGNIPDYKYLLYIFYNLIKSMSTFLVFKHKVRAPIDYQYKSDNFFESNIYTKLYQFYLLQARFCIKKLIIKKKYKRLCHTNIFSTKYVYFAAQFKPEASADPESGKFLSHIQILKELRKNLPSEYAIVYKEHPNQFHHNSMWDIQKDNKYYKELQKIKKLIFVSDTYDSFDLIDNCQFVVTLSGNVGFESVARNRHCMIFSKTWYSDFSGVYLIKTFNEIKKFIKIKKKKINHKLNIKIYSKIINNTVIIKSFSKIQNNILKDKKYFKKLLVKSIFN